MGFTCATLWNNVLLRSRFMFHLKSGLLLKKEASNSKVVTTLQSIMNAAELLSGSARCRYCSHVGQWAYCILLYPTVSYRILLYPIVSYRILLYPTVSYCILLYPTVSYRGTQLKRLRVGASRAANTNNVPQCVVKGSGRGSFLFTFSVY